MRFRTRTPSSTGVGKVGGAVARAFAREGARVFLAGRTLESLGEVAEEIFVETRMLKRVETPEDVGNGAAFVVSDLARATTATAINIKAGRVAD